MLGFHGEVVAVKVQELPEDLELQDVESLVVSKSMDSGNDHILEDSVGMASCEKDGVLYVKLLKPATLKCVKEGRHDPQQLEAGFWKFGIAKEFNPFIDGFKDIDEVITEPRTTFVAD